MSNETASFLHSLPEDVWRNANQYASGCERWKVADVVAHLVSAGMMLRLAIPRALKGDISPPLGYRETTGDDHVEGVRSLRVTFDEDLFREFYTTCKQVNTLFAEVEPNSYDAPVWHPGGSATIADLVERRVLELAVHGWDIRYGLDRSAGLSVNALPFLVDFMPKWLRTYFREGSGPVSPIRYRFDLSDSDTGGYDVVVASQDFRLAPSDDSDPDVTFRCDTNGYVLFGMGRLPFARSVRRGRLSFDGDDDLAAKFTDWFPTR